MILEVYADESGIHDLGAGQEPNSEVPVIAGYINSAEKWLAFSQNWQTILEKFNVPYFHFSEYNARRRSPHDASNPYHHLNDEQLEDMLYEFAIEAGNTSVPVGGMYHVKKHHETGAEGDPATKLWEIFFTAFWEQMAVNWPEFSGQVVFIFDQSTNDEWALVINRVFRRAVEKDSRISDWRFANDEKDLSLQAADLFAYVTHQVALPYMDANRETQEWRILDVALRKNNSPNEFDHSIWKVGIYALIHDMRSQRAEADAAGLPRRRYFPRVHYPFFRE